MRRRYVKIAETGRVFKSISECDNFLGHEGVTASILKLDSCYHKRYNLHVVEIDAQEYDKYKAVNDDRYKDIVYKYQIPCEWCGELFHPTNIHQKFCNRKHYQICSVCGKQFDVSNLILANKDVPATCSKECSMISRKKTIKDRQQDPNYEASKLAKRRQTCLDKYGVDNVSKSNAVKQKIVSTIQDKYGVDNPGKIPEAIHARNEYLNDQKRIELANLRREDTNLKKFGAKYITQTAAHRIAQGFDEIHATRLEKFYRDPKQYVLDNFDSKPTAFQLYQHFSTHEPLSKLYGTELVKWNVSTMEQDVASELLKLVPNLEIKHNDRTVIRPLKLDIYLPRYNLAIECNPTYTHNSSLGSFDSNALSYDYHYQKTEMCENAGIQLFHIFGYEWTHKRTQIISMLANLLHENQHKVYARNCEVRKLDSATAKRFLDVNHRQGYAASSINLGLYHQDELVAAMTFGKSRSTIGNNEGIELIRFCTLNSYSVLGAASKLFKYFTDVYHPSIVISYSDRAHTTGKLYEVLGFRKQSISKPNYVWVNVRSDVAYHRINAQKHNIKKFLYDDSIDLTKTEKQIMIEHGFVQVYDSGTITWVWKSEV